MKYLAVVDRCEGGFRGYVPRLPGCEVRAATAEEAEANIIAAARARLTADNGVKPEDIEVIVAVEAPPPPRPRGDGLDEVYDRLRREFDPKCLELLMNWENEVWYPFEDILEDLEEGSPPQATDGPKE
jgi:predicted RNase H-like HicB family nuclease